MLPADGPLVPQNSDWLFYGMPATIALSSMLLLTVVSFKQRALWGWLGLIFVVVLAMSGWLKWQVEAVEKWRWPSSSGCMVSGLC